jgi:hypothetical protein
MIWMRRMLRRHEGRRGVTCRLKPGPNLWLLNMRQWSQQYRRVGRAARQRIANPSLSNGWIGSTPILSAKFGFKVFMDAHGTVTAEEWDRYPLEPPNNGYLMSSHK